MTESVYVLLILTGFGSLFGLAIGSFLNVVISRVPHGESVVWPGSHCPNCGTAIRAIDNIPLLSFLRLGGRCRHCRGKISRRYPLVELLTAVIFAGIVWKNGGAPESLVEMAFAASMIALIFIDAGTRTLPNVITYPLLIGGLLANLWRWGWGDPLSYGFDFSLLFSSREEVFSAPWLAIRGGLLIGLAAPLLWLLDRLDLFLFGKYFEVEEFDATDGDFTPPESHSQAAIARIIIVGILAGIGWALFVILSGSDGQLTTSSADRGLITAVTGALVGVLPVWLLRTCYFQLRGREGMGLGDIKMMAGIGAFLGWQGALSVLLLGSTTGAIFGLVLARRGGAGLQTVIPFGCFLGLAALITLFRSAL